ncbi:MAG: hypothetical protein JWP97_55, partial [Labilithrix sp.]|nr:hypothetical protein [Labilithrix sp.]
SSSLDEQRTPARARAEGSDKDRTTIHLARSAPLARGLEARWFLPEGSCDLRSSSGGVEIDASGIVHPGSVATYDELSFRSGPRCANAGPDRALAPPAPPGPLDLALSPPLVRQLARASRAWTRGSPTDRAKLDSIARELGRFGYSLDVDRRRGLDAVIDLLYVHQEGHCELFASAMALLARTNGIPARVISGYRVTEYSSLGHAVVRERNAHTWVEAWVDGRWESWDPTPAVEHATLARTSRWERITETLGWAFQRTIDFFWNIGLFNAGAFGTALVVVLLIVRRLTQRGARRGDHELVLAGRPLPAFERLTASLARAGWVRSPSEPLEAFARRLGESDAAWSREAADAIGDYARLRYGGLGEESTAVARLSALAERVRHSVRAA